MDLHRFEILAGLLWLSLGLALIPAMLMSHPRKPRRRLLVPTLLIPASSIVLLDGYARATQVQRVAIADGTYNVTSVNDYWLYLDTGGAIHPGVHMSDLVSLKDSKDNVVVIEDGHPTAYISDSPVIYTSDQFALETRPGQASPSLAHIKTDRLDGSLRIDRIVTHHEDATLLVVDKDEVVLKVPQGF